VLASELYMRNHGSASLNTSVTDVCVCACVCVRVCKSLFWWLNGRMSYCASNRLPGEKASSGSTACGLSLLREVFVPLWLPSDDAIMLRRERDRAVDERFL